MKTSLSRREFLKLSLLTLGSLAFNPFPQPQDEGRFPSQWVARVTVDRRAAIYEEPNDQSKASSLIGN